MIGTTLGHYRIIEQIGAGGMGVVYRAHDERLDRDVAIKVLPEAVAGDPDRLARFEREAKALAALSHPNIAVVYGLESAPAGTDTETDTGTGRSCLVMELLEGESLREVISSGRLTVGKAVEHAQAIADGLAAAHDKDIVHRDLKPENIFITADGRVKILDFGLAKLKTSEIDLTTETPTATLETVGGAVMGTVPYMAPEQVRGGDTDHRADIFAMGCVLYEMLAGRRPYTGGSSAEVAAAILKEDPAPLPDKVPDALRTVVRRCLEKRPEDRFDSAHDLSLTLGALDSSASVWLPSQEASFVHRRWPHVLAIAIAAVIALVVILPPQGLFERSMGQGELRPKHSIAIMPLENLTGDSEQQYLVDGLHQELITTVAQVSGFDKVIGRHSVVALKNSGLSIHEIGRKLRVETVAEGSVRQFGDRVRVALQLVDANSERLIWSDSFERSLTDIIALQSEMARAVSKQLKVLLNDDEERRLDSAPTVNSDAYRAYLRGLRLSQWFSTEEALEAALGEFEVSISLDAEFAPAHEGLSLALFQLGNYFRRPSEVLPAAMAAAQRAVELDPGLSNAHYRLALIRFWWQWDWEEAEAGFRRALELNPSNSRAAARLAELLACFGETDEAVAVMRRAFEIDPLNPSAHSGLGWIYYLTGRYREGIEHLEQAATMFPNNVLVRNALACNLYAVGRYEEADAQFKKVAEFAPALIHTPIYLGLRAWTYGAIGEIEKSHDLLEQLLEMRDLRYVPPVWIALAQYATGDEEQMFASFEQALEVHDTALWQIPATQWFKDMYSDDPRFKELLEGMGLSAEVR
jgi:serine/threonine protein kinase/Tfp pilus assembly protein PilF